MKKMLCFDMDGTIADLYGVPRWLDMLIAENPLPYMEAKPLCDMDALREKLEEAKAGGWEIRVISWLAKDSSDFYKTAVRKAKIDWLKKYNFPFDACHLVAYGTTKANCIRRYYEKGDQFILIDDNDKVRDGWHMGGVINPVTTDIIKAIDVAIHSFEKDADGWA